MGPKKKKKNHACAEIQCENINGKKKNEQSMYRPQGKMRPKDCLVEK